MWSWPKQSLSSPSEVSGLGEKLSFTYRNCGRISECFDGPNTAGKSSECFDGPNTAGKSSECFDGPNTAGKSSKCFDSPNTCTSSLPLRPGFRSYTSSGRLHEEEKKIVEAKKS